MKLKKRKNLWYQEEIQWTSTDELTIEYEGKVYVLKLESDSHDGIDIWEGKTAADKKRINRLNDEQRQEICDFLEDLVAHDFDASVLNVKTKQ